MYVCTVERANKSLLTKAEFYANCHCGYNHLPDCQKSCDRYKRHMLAKQVLSSINIMLSVFDEAVKLEDKVSEEAKNGEV